MTRSPTVAAQADPWVFERRGNLYKYTWANGAGVLNGVASRLGSVRIANGLFYATPVFGGLSASFGVGLREGGTATTQTGRGRQAASISYASGPLFVNAAVDRSGRLDGVWLVNAGYDFGTFKPTINIAESKIAGWKQRTWLIATTITLGTNLVKLGYGHYDDRSPANADSQRASVGLEHFLSKRTSLYTNGFTEKINGLGNVRGADLGITHRF